MNGRVAVIGGGIGGLTAAGLLAKRGRDVVLFEQADTLGGKAGRLVADGLTFDTGPTLLALPHLIESVFEELDAEMPRLHRLAEQCRYQFADGRSFQVFDDPEATFDSAEQLGEGEGARLREFYRLSHEIYRFAGEPFLGQPLQSMTGFARAVLGQGARGALLGMRLGTLDSLARGTVKTAQLRQFIGRFATYVGASPYRASAAYAMIAHAERAFGVHHPEGGMGALAQALARAVTRAGVDVRLGCRAEWSAVRGGFQVHGEHFEQLIVNADPTTQRGPELSLSAYVLLLRVAGAFRLPHHSILFAPEPRAEFEALFAGRLPPETTIYVCNPAATDESMAHPHETGLYVMVNTPPWSGPFPAPELRARLIAAVAPGAEVVAERTPADFARTGSPLGALYGAVGHGRFGPFRRPRMRGPYRGQFFAGAGTHPGGGVPLVAQSGRFAADLAMREARP